MITETITVYLKNQTKYIDCVNNMAQLLNVRTRGRNSNHAALWILSTNESERNLTAC
jgi:hypothetical protein